MNTVQLGSLDLFWMPQVQRALQSFAETELYSTWSLKRAAPNPGCKAVNNAILHYVLQITKMVPAVNFHNKSYHRLCCLFDEWFSGKVRSDVSLVAYLSGVGLKTEKKCKALNIPTVIECGSTHTDFQHEILLAEFQRNGISEPLFPEAYRDRVRREFEVADFIQVPSHFVAKTFLERGIPAGKLLMAPYGTDLSVFKPKDSWDPDAPFRVICPSGINLRKGARVLVEAWRKLGWRDAELVWIGAVGRQTAHLFTEPLPGLRLECQRPHLELAALYRSCDVFVLPSFEEGLARVVMEAAASGLPLIATPNTGVENFFTPSASEGWLIPANNVDALCEVLIAAKADREQTFRLGQRAAQRAKVGFSWEDYGKKVLANYKTALEGNSARQDLLL